MQVQDYAREYAAKTDDELSRLAIVRDELTLEAQFALTAEMNARGITSAQVDVFRVEEDKRKQEESKDTGQLWFLHAYGIGRKRFGKAERKRIPDSKREQFKTTVFIVLFWLPVIPIGTYLVEKERGFLSDDHIAVLERLRLDWEQVLQVWAVASMCLLGLIWAFKLLTHIYMLRS